MITSELREQIEELNNEDYSYSEIAEELGITNQEVLSILQEIESDYDDENTHEPLSGIEKANELEERKLAIEEKKLKKETVERKRTILNQFRELCSGILDKIQGASWDKIAIKKTYKEVILLQEQVEDQFVIDSAELGDNSIFEILSVLKNEFEPLTKKDPDYQFRMNWSSEKVEMLKYGSEIKNFDEKDWDRSKYELDRAFGYYRRFLDSLYEYKEENVNIEIVETLQSSLLFAKEVIEKYEKKNKSSDFKKELEVLDEIDSYFNELKIRIDESFWGEKKLKISEHISTLIDEVEASLVQEGDVDE